MEMERLPAAFREWVGWWAVLGGAVVVCASIKKAEAQTQKFTFELEARNSAWLKYMGDLSVNHIPHVLQIGVHK